MLVVKKCSFCGQDLKRGYGVMFVKNDGSIQYFCSSKCKKSALKLKRDPRRLKWTSHYKKEGVVG